jgi:GH25 family lysozyme M1 (1,4-beta-N-acetylmuramidase)
MRHQHLRQTCGARSLPTVETFERRLLMARVPGIDVSHWQGTINWGNVAAAGKKFAFQKATESIDYVDPTMTTNLTNGKNAGLLMGVYHFARPSTAVGDAVAEANWFVDRAGQYMTPGHLPPVLDLEDGASMTPAQLTTWVQQFETRVEQRTGVVPIIYCNTNYATNEVTSAVNVYPLWIANWSSAYGDPNTTGSPPCGVWGAGNWEFWQHSSTGAVSGISGNVDLDVFDGTLAQLQAMLIQNPDQIPPTVQSAEFVYQTAPHRLRFTFSEDVSASLSPTDLVVRDVNTQATLVISSVTWSPATLTATFTLNNLAPDGSYRATLSGAGVTDPAGNPLGDDHTLDFFFLTGDADHDGAVNLNDFNTLASNFGQSGRDFTQGDFDYNGTVNLNDFNLLASNFGRTMAAPATSPTTSTSSVDADEDPVSALLA